MLQHTSADWCFRTDPCPRRIQPLEGARRTTFRWNWRGPKCPWTMDIMLNTYQRYSAVGLVGHCRRYLIADPETALLQGQLSTRNRWKDASHGGVFWMFDSRLPVPLFILPGVLFRTPPPHNHSHAKAALRRQMHDV